MDWLIALVSLAMLEIVLGIDNLVFIAVLAAKLPPEQQNKARQLGLAAALVTRLLLLFAIKWILGLNEPIFSLSELGLPASWLGEETREFSVRDLILLGGGLFLIAKATFEIHDKLEGEHEKKSVQRAAGFASVIFQIMLLDIVFSLDSVITAVGMVREIWIMVAAMFITVGVMLVFAGPVSNFVHRHPTMKILALSFLILIGVMLVAEGFGQHIERGYVYFAMGFSLVVELINMRVRKAEKPVELREPPPVTR